MGRAWSASRHLQSFSSMQPEAMSEHALVQKDMRDGVATITPSVYKTVGDSDPAQN